MRIISGELVLRCPEPRDVPQLYIYRNDTEVTELLGGFSTGYSITDLMEWIDFHRAKSNEVIWVIADKASDLCLGHVGLYNIDHRIRKAEYAIMIGDKASWGRGLGSKVSRYVIDYAFDHLNLHRIELEVLSINARAVKLYLKLGFQQEGILRDAQYRSGSYIDVVRMGLLEHERNWR